MNFLNAVANVLKGLFVKLIGRHQQPVRAEPPQVSSTVSVSSEVPVETSIVESATAISQAKPLPVESALEPFKPANPTITHPPYHEMRPTRQQSYRNRTLGTLLANVEDTFRANVLPYNKFSWIDKENITALKHLGTYVPFREGFDFSETFAELFASTPQLPALFALSYGFSKHDKDDEDLCHPTHFVGYRLRATPPNIDYCPGQLYGFGMSVRLTNKGSKDKKSLIWFGGFVTVKPDGTIYIHAERRSRYHPITKGRKHSRGYSAVGWGEQPFVEMFNQDNRTAEEREELVRIFFAHALHDWIMRKESWSVNVRKDNSKITFSVPKEETASYFKDRLKVTTETGATKRILHYVNEHERTRNGVTTTVKAHIRGLDRFDWKGYECRITAPDFNGQLTSEFNIPGLEEEHHAKRNCISVQRLVRILNQMEEHRSVFS